MRPTIIAPSLLAADFTQLGNDIEKVTNNFRFSNSNNSAFAKHKELLDRATRTSDPIDKINLLQRAEHYLKISNGVEF